MKKLWNLFIEKLCELKRTDPVLYYAVFGLWCLFWAVIGAAFRYLVDIVINTIFRRR